MGAPPLITDIPPKTEDIAELAEMLQIAV